MCHQIAFYIILCLVFQRSYCQNYGPFKLALTKFDVCAGPRNKNCTSIRTTGTDTSGGMLMANFHVLENITPNKAKIQAMSNGKELIRLQMNKPCEHMILRTIMNSLFAGSKNCMILKGDYKIKLDMYEMISNYFGEKFFYGNVSFKAVLYGSDCNFSCTNTYVTLTPKN